LRRFHRVDFLSFLRVYGAQAGSALSVPGTAIEDWELAMNIKLILGLVVVLGLIGGSLYGFETGMFKPDPKAMAEIPDGD
jgi:hypothetical protein